MTPLRPLHYTLKLVPDLETFTFSGRADIVLEAESAQSDIVLNGNEIRIKSCVLLLDGKEQSAEFSQPDPEKQTFRVRFPETVTGRFSLRIEYTGRINDSMMGFYRSAYTDASGRKKHIAVTQFEESEARKAFPCLDEPALKATFDVEYVIDAGLTGVSNMPVEREEALPGGKKRVRFECTPVMSTYLLFFGVGEFDILEDKGRVLLRALTTPGKVHLAEQGLRFARKCLDYLEKEFGTPFP
ncbi:MAG: M1 family peptidase, partial [Candidatus Aminicenantes bacterium]|nr:M1 family peptidase [Candidatus Aminicenantes bacterium]